MIDPEAEIRIIIHARVTDIPESPYRRHITLGEIFSEKVLCRPFKQAIKSEGYDNVTIPPDVESEKPVKRWFIYDFNVKGAKTREELLTTPHKVYLAYKQENDWVFVLRDIWIDQAKQRCKSYVWGGRLEQQWLAEIKQGSMEETIDEVT